MSNLNKNWLGLCVAGATLASSAVMFTAKPAQAATFTVNGTDYDITTVTGSYNSLTTQLQATPWWGNSLLAEALANEVWDSLGYTSLGGGPVFASVGTDYPIQTDTGIEYPDGPLGFYLGLEQGSDTPSVRRRGLVESNVFSFAVGTAVPAAVPEPLTILGSITAAGFGVVLKRKKNSKKEE